MEKENISENINNTFIHQINKSNIINNQKEEKEITEYSKISNINSDNNINNTIKKINLKKELLSNIENIENINPNIQIKQNEVSNQKKWNNNKVNGTLNDIYGSIANINEVNKKVKNLLSNMPIIHETNNNKRSFITKSNNINKVRPATEEKIINKKTKYIKLNEIKDFNNPGTLINRNVPNSAKNYYQYNLNKDINYNNINYSMIDNPINNPNIYNIKNKTNNNISQFDKISPYISNNTSNIFANNSIKPISRNDIKIFFNKKASYNNIESINSKINDPFVNNEDIGKVSNNYSMISSLVNSEILNINNSLFYDDGLKNEKDIKNMKLKLKIEEKKLKDLEQEKHRLLKEEKIRRRIIMENIQKRNKIKKQALLKEYQKKIHLVKKLQAQNISEIIKLERTKKNDENKIRKINKIFNNDEGINFNNTDLYELIKKNKKKSRKNRNNDLRENNLDGIEKKIYVSRNDNNIQKFFTFSDGFAKLENQNINEENIKEKNTNEDLKFINTLNDLSTSYNNSNKTRSLSSFTNYYHKVSNNYNKHNYQKELFKNLSNNYSEINIKKINPQTNFIYNENDDINYNNKRIILSDYINKQNSPKKKKYNKFNFDSRTNKVNNNKKYKKIFSPKIEIPSFIKARVNKYNYSNSQKSNTSHRISVGKMFPYSLNYNFNTKYNYNIPSSISNKSNQNYYPKDTDKRNYNKRSRKSRDLNFKHIFFNNE